MVEISHTWKDSLYIEIGPGWVNFTIWTCAMISDQTYKWISMTLILYNSVYIYCIDIDSDINIDLNIYSASTFYKSYTA